MHLLLFLLISLQAQRPNLNPVTWSLSAQPGKLVLHAQIAEHYKLFSPTKSTPGPIPLRVKVLESKWLRTAKPVAPSQYQTLTGETDIAIPYTLRRKLPNDGLTVHVEVEYQSCSDQICLPITRRTLVAKLLPPNPVL
jgi:hypothetical protein